MKLEPRTFRIFWDVHAWVGVVGALLLYVMFFAATFAPFEKELDEWAAPRAAKHGGRGFPAKIQPLLGQLAREEHVVGKDRVAFMPSERGLDAYWSQGDERVYFRYAPRTQRLERTRSELGSFLYELHYLGQIPYGIYVAGVAAMALFLALLTGLLVHWKGLVREWFQFRPSRIMRTWSSDMHKVLGVFGLPYQLFYAWSGAVLCLAWVTVEPTFTAVVFRGNERAAAVVRGETAEPLSPTGKKTKNLPNLDGMIARARAEVPGLTPEWIGIENVGDEGSSVSVYGRVNGIAFGTADVIFRARDEAVIQVSSPRTATSLQRFEAWFFGMHYVQFGGYAIKLLYAFLSLATCAVIVTGNLVWLERRDKARASLGNRILERLTIGFCAGITTATGAMFLVNRCFSASFAHRSTTEQAVFWSVLGIAVLAPFVWRVERRVAAWELLIAGVCFALVPAIDAITLSPTLASPVYFGIDLALVAFASALIAGALSLFR